MNIWRLKKNPTLRVLLLRLNETLNPDQWMLPEPNMLDERAVRICQAGNPSLSAYIFCYGQADDRYAVDLEFPETEGQTPYFERFEELTLEQMLAVLSSHLGAE